jgi:hypothetical protein
LKKNRYGGAAICLRRYLKNFELVRKKRPYLESFLPSDERTEATNAKEAAATKDEGLDEKAIARAVESGLNAALNKITTKIFSFIYVGLLVFFGIYLVYNYGLTILGFLAAAVYMVGHGIGIW